MVWEPCAGRGDLVDSVLRATPSVEIRASEIDAVSADALRHKYARTGNITVVNEDALEVSCSNLFEKIPCFSRVIANPPYGAYQTPERRALLKRRFPSLYVRETYGLLLYHAFSLLQRHGRLVFIVPDTFLWLNRHEHLRRTLLAESTIEEISLFPSKFFPGIRFGYSGLCIITLVKKPPADSHHIRVVEDLRDPQVLVDLANCDGTVNGCSIFMVAQRKLLERRHGELHKPLRADEVALSGRVSLTLADVAEVRTGFYSGNDRRWLRRASEQVPRSKHFLNVEYAMVFQGLAPPLDGVDQYQHFVPILRGGAASFIRPTRWYVDWSVEAVKEYRRPGKNPARFQNAQFYFRSGIGVPMVSSGRLTAAMLDNRLFDQGIVAIFPRDNALSHFLLGFMNTELATKLLRQINPTANNSANYLKRLPIVMPTSTELDNVNLVVEQAIMESRDYGTLNPDTRARLESAYREMWCQQSPV